MSRSHDVVVVGASCAGLVVARDVAAAGMRTLVVDSRRDLAEPSRTWIVTQKLDRLLDRDLAPCVVHRTGVMELFADGLRRRVRLQRPDLVVERSILRDLLARDAEAAGAELRLGERVGEVAAAPGGFRVRIGSNGHAPALTRNVVGADGTRSVVAAALGAPRLPAVPVVQARVALPAGYDPDVTRVWFDPDRTRFFYWLIPESDRAGVIGLIAERSANARRLLDDFLAVQGMTPLEYQGAMIPLHQPRRRIEWRPDGRRVLLVGDAAGHVKITTVGGVVSGIWGARAASRALVRGTSYRRELRPLHRELYLHDLVRWTLDRFDRDHYGRLLELLNAPLDALLSRHDRDSYFSRTLALLRAQPRLVPLFLDALRRPRERQLETIALARDAEETLTSVQ